MDVRIAMEEYLASIKHLRPLTQKGYQQRLEVFCAWCEAQKATVHLGEIKKLVIDQFVGHLRATHTSHKAGADGISTYTLAGYVRCILSFLRWCMESEAYEQLVSPTVVCRIKKPKVTKVIIETFTSEQLQALLSACNNEYNEHLSTRDRAMLYLLIDTGIRAFELCTLTIAHTHLEANDSYIKILGKGQKWREVGLGAQSREALKQYVFTYRQGANVTDTLFINRYQKSLTVNGLEKIIRRLGRWAHIKGVRCSPHTFRHTYACAYLLQGGDIFKLSLLMGHENIETTQIYLRTIQSRSARRGMSVLDQMGVK